MHSVSAVGEQYVALIPRSENSPPLKDGDVIPVADTWVPPDINSLFDSANAGLDAIPDDALTTMVDESYVAVGVWALSWRGWSRVRRRSRSTPANTSMP